MSRLVTFVVVFGVALVIFASFRIEWIDQSWVGVTVVALVLALVVTFVNGGHESQAEDLRLDPPGSPPRPRLTGPGVPPGTFRNTGAPERHSFQKVA